MRVLITGGAGFIGRRLAEALLAKGELAAPGGEVRRIERVRIADVAEPHRPFPADARLETVYGDFSVPGAAQRLLDAQPGLVFHLAAVVSGEAERNFDLGMRINLHGTLRLLEACRALENPPRVVFTSSVAVFGGDMPEVIDDATQPTPQTSYGAQKVMGELLISEFTRKGFIDGRVLRLPTVVVRPGKANAAASSFASAVIREPIEGREYVCPVGADTGVWLLSPRRVVDALVRAASLDSGAWGANRALCLPGTSITVARMLEGLREVAGGEVAARVRYAPDPFIERIVCGWPTRFAPRRARALGFQADDSFRAVVEAFIEDAL